MRTQTYNHRRSRPTVSFTMRDDNLHLLDEISRVTGLKRSAVLEEILDYHLHGNPPGSAIFQFWVNSREKGEVSPMQ